MINKKGIKIGFPQLKMFGMIEDSRIENEIEEGVDLLGGITIEITGRVIILRTSLRINNQGRRRIRFHK